MLTCCLAGPQPGTFSTKALLEFCSQAFQGDLPRLRQIQALIHELKVRSGC